jgi:hypothetical protein
MRHLEVGQAPEFSTKLSLMESGHAESLATAAVSHSRAEDGHSALQIIYLAAVE